MQVKIETIEKVTISYQASESKEALEYCSLGKYKIVDMDPVRDGRSGHYTGEIIIGAERAIQQPEAITTTPFLSSQT